MGLEKDEIEKHLRNLRERSTPSAPKERYFDEDIRGLKQAFESLGVLDKYEADLAEIEESFEKERTQGMASDYIDRVVSLERKPRMDGVI